MAYLIPVLLLVVGSRLLLVRPFATPKTKALGAALLVTSLSALLELFPYTPAVRGLIHGSGMLGYLAAAGLVHTFNHLGRGHCCRRRVPLVALSGHTLLFLLGGGFPEGAMAGTGTASRGALAGVAGSPRQRLRKRGGAVALRRCGHAAS